MWTKNPLYFLTLCCADRRHVLANDKAANILLNAWQNSPRLYGWIIGCYVIMPDHVHFFARPLSHGKPLSTFMRNWKRWTANQIIKQAALTPPLWQPEFFDHVIRSADSYSEKWAYVQANPVRAGLAPTPDLWPYTGEIIPLAF